ARRGRERREGEDAAWRGSLRRTAAVADCQVFRRHGTSSTGCAKVRRPAVVLATRRPSPARRFFLMAKAVIVSATRTAIGTLGGALAQQPATKLGAIAVREAI